MTIYVNNKEQDIPAGTNILRALDLLNISSANGIAVAINNEVVSKAQWAEYKLNDNDKLLLIKAAAGG
jgi:sulfur carrier protein